MGSTNLNLSVQVCNKCHLEYLASEHCFYIIDSAKLFLKRSSSSAQKTVNLYFLIEALETMTLLTVDLFYSKYLE